MAMIPVGTLNNPVTVLLNSNTAEKQIVNTQLNAVLKSQLHFSHKCTSRPPLAQRPQDTGPWGSCDRSKPVTARLCDEVRSAAARRSRLCRGALFDHDCRRLSWSERHRCETIPL